MPQLEEPTVAEGTEPPINIAIIGGGIAGLYCAYKFAGAQPQRIHLFESAAECGGRIFTGHFSLPLQAASLRQVLPPGLTADEFFPEYGPMRIEPEHQALLDGLLNELEIKGEEELAPERRGLRDNPCLISFPDYASPLSVDEPQYPLKGEEAEQQTPLDLMKLAFVRIIGRLTAAADAGGGIKEVGKDGLTHCLFEMTKALNLVSASRQPEWKPALQTWIDNLAEADYQNLRDYAEFDKIPLCQIGYWNLLSDVLSHNAVLKLRDLGTFYHLLPENPNAAEWLIFWLRALKTTKKLRGVYRGMSHIPRRLTAKILSPREEGGHTIKVHCRKTLEKISADGGLAKLEFSDGTICTAKHVVLALPKAPLEQIVQTNRVAFPDEIAAAVDGVVGFPLLKVFIVVKRRWWEEEHRANVGATRMPTRELHYWKSDVPGSTRGMIMIYTDRPGTSFWANYVAAPGPQTDADEWFEQSGVPLESFPASPSARLIKKVVRQLRELGVDRIQESDIECCGIRDWGRAPYGGAAHAWRPERNATNLLKALAAFNLKGSTRNTSDGNIHVCGEAYSDYQAFIEGSLRSAAHVLHKIDPSHTLTIDATKKYNAGEHIDAGAADGAANEVLTPTPWLCECPKCKAEALRARGKGL